MSKAAQATQPELLPAESKTTEEAPGKTRTRGLQKAQPQTTTLAVAQPQQPRTDMEVFADIAADPNVDLAKLERLIALKEHMLSITAKSAFDADFAQMQGDLPEIDESGRIEIEGQKARAYAKNEDIQKAIRPVLKKYGFALSFREQKAEDGKMVIVGILSHKGGHREEDRFVTAPDDGGRMNTIQRRGSARSYGQRYITIFLLNISTREQGFADDDGQGSERPEAPEGFQQFMTELQKAARGGNKPLYAFWNKADPKLRQHVTKHYRSEWAAMKAEAEKVVQQ